MCKKIFFIFVTLMYMPVAHATVYEYNNDGTVLKHEAFDYRSSQGMAQFEIVQPAVIQTTPAFSLLTADNHYETYIQKSAENYGLHADLIRAVIQAESAGNKNIVSPKGAQGLMQLMPATARQYGVTDPFDPEQNIDGGAKYLSYLFKHYDGDTRLALAAYNSGEGTVDKYGGIPPYAETKDYVKKIEHALKKTLKN